MSQSIPTLLTRLWHHISSRRRSQFALLLILMIAASFAEILSIGSILPFLAVLTDPNRIFQLPAAQPFIKMMGFTAPDQLLKPLTITFALAALISGATRLLLLWASTRLSFATGADLRDLVGTGIPFILSSKSNTSSRELAHEDIYTESQQHIP